MPRSGSKPTLAEIRDAEEERGWRKIKFVLHLLAAVVVAYGFYVAYWCKEQSEGLGCWRFASGIVKFLSIFYK